MSRMRRIHIPVTTDSNGHFITTVPVHGHLVGIATRPFPATAAQTVTIAVDATGGTFTISRNAVATAAIAANATAQAVQDALNAVGKEAICSQSAVVTRSGSINAYTYTIAFSGVGTYLPGSLNLDRRGLGTYATVTTGTGSLTGGASTATVTNIGLSPLSGISDLVITDRLSSVQLYVDTTISSSATYLVPHTVVTDMTSAAIAAAAGYTINVPVPLAGPVDVGILNGTAATSGDVWLFVTE